MEKSRSNSVERASNCLRFLLTSTADPKRSNAHAEARRRDACVGSLARHGKCIPPPCNGLWPRGDCCWKSARRWKSSLRPELVAADNADNRSYTDNTRAQRMGNRRSLMVTDMVTGMHGMCCALHDSRRCYELHRTVRLPPGYIHVPRLTWV
jgi:hypothetical protein